MNLDDTLIIAASNIQSLLQDKELQIIDIIRKAYLAFGRGNTVVPHSSFLRFPGQPNDRIIALPAFICSQEKKTAGIKWISSFPGNHALKIDRASAFIAINSLETGRTEAIMEGSLISAKRTAASAALAAKLMDPYSSPESVGIIGLGIIALETLRFLLSLFPSIKQLNIYDTAASRCENFSKLSHQLSDTLNVTINDSGIDVIQHSELICFATNAGAPHTHIDNKCQGRKTVLNISLRDLTAETILNASNIVDDVDHVCRANTSVHLAAQSVGHRDFIDSTIYELLKGTPAPQDKNLSIFSPFGLGMLDIAIASFVLESAKAENIGTLIPDFFPTYWLER